LHAHYPASIGEVLGTFPNCFKEPPRNILAIDTDLDRFCLSTDTLLHIMLFFFALEEA
jgi:hypothetical protein